MEKNVLVCVKGLHYTDDNKVKDEVEVTTTGIYLENNGDKYVRFEEVLDDKSVVKNIIKISGDTVDATKKGAVDMQIHFREKMKFITPYMTPYGAIQLGVFTDKIEIEESRDKILINANYQLEVNGQYQNNCAMKISIQSN